jgi:hypothetical protein
MNSEPINPLLFQLTFLIRAKDLKVKLLIFTVQNSWHKAKHQPHAEMLQQTGAYPGKHNLNKNDQQKKVS